MPLSTTQSSFCGQTRQYPILVQFPVRSFQGAKKGTPFAASKVGEVIGSKAATLGVKEAEVGGPGSRFRVESLPSGPLWLTALTLLLSKMLRLFRIMAQNRKNREEYNQLRIINYELRI